MMNIGVDPARYIPVHSCRGDRAWEHYEAQVIAIAHIDIVDRHEDIGLFLKPDFVEADSSTDRVLGSDL